MFGFDGNTTFGYACIQLLTLTKEAVVEIMLDLFDQPEDLMTKLNGVSDKRNPVNHFLTQPDHVTAYTFSFLDLAELGRGTLGVCRSFRQKKTMIYMAIRLNNAGRGIENATAIGKRLLMACESESDASFAEATQLCSEHMGNIASDVLDMSHEVEINGLVQTRAPLMKAIARKNMRCINLLLEAGASVSKTCRVEKGDAIGDLSPLLLAISFNYEESFLHRLI